MSLGVCVSVCVSAALHIFSACRAVAACCISLGDEGNVLYPVLASCFGDSREDSLERDLWRLRIKSETG